MTFTSTSLLCLTAFVMVLLGSGCASPNVNPKSAAANSGYVDFYSGTNDRLAWEVQRFDPAGQQFKVIFSDINPAEEGIVRLRFAPGQYRFRVTFLNRVIAAPALLDLEIKNGCVIPILVTLKEVGTSSVQTRQTSHGGTASGRYGRRTTIGSYEASTYRVTAMPQPLQPYQIKQRMPYAQLQAK